MVRSIASRRCQKAPRLLSPVKGSASNTGPSHACVRTSGIHAKTITLLNECGPPSKNSALPSPILARSATGEVCDGHLRLKAGIAEKMTEIPVIPCDSWTDAQVKAFRLLVNRSVTWADWDLDLLAAELGELHALDYDLGLTGFEDEELARLLEAQDAAEGLTDEDSVPELPETPITISGDLWIFGDHRVLCGDATLRVDVDRLMADVAADLVFTDPPYNVDYEGYTEDRLTIKGDRMTPAQFEQFLLRGDVFHLPELSSSLAPRCTCVTLLRGSRCGVPGSPWRLRASRSGARSSGQRIHSRGDSAAINFNTSRSFTATLRAKKMPGTGTNLSRRFGKKTSPPPIESTRQRSRSNWLNARSSTAARQATLLQISSAAPVRR